MRSNFFSPLRRRGLLAWRTCTFAALLSIPITSVEAQTLFSWPELTAHVERYATVEECFAAAIRIRDSEESASIAWSDTLPESQTDAAAPHAQAVVAAAQQCGARFTPAQATRENFVPLMQLFLVAGRDSDASAVSSWRLARVSTKSEQVAVLDTLTQVYLGEPFLGLVGKPPRLAAAESMLTVLGNLATARQWHVKMQDYYALMQASLLVADTARALRAADGVVAMSRAITAADRRDYAPDITMWTYSAMSVLSQRAALDSLRRSTASYVTLLRAVWAKAAGERPDALRYPIGEQAPVIEGDFWYRRGGSSEPHPSPGKVSFIVFIDQTECADPSLPCYREYARLHRLARRFPELDITIVASTQGYLSDAAPPQPQAEAEMLRQLWLDDRKLPGALAVTATDFWRLPSLDRRRINRDTRNATGYSFGRMWYVSHDSDYLVDQHGTIVHAGTLTQPGEESRLHTLIEILLTRQTASR